MTSFHADLDAGRFARIYDGGATELKAAGTRERFEQFLGAVHTKLGRYLSGTKQGWRDNVTTGGHFMTLSYQSTFEKGTADETFTFSISGDRAAFVGYHINSDALVIG